MIWELDLWKKEKETEFKVELERRKLEMLERFSQSQREKFREKLRKLRAFEAGLDSLEKKLKIKLNEMLKRERKLSKNMFLFF